jgi:hypothetical protein
MFPYPHTYPSLLDGTHHVINYKCHIDITKLIFHGKSDSHNLCIKFVPTYSIEVHEHCSSQGYPLTLRGFKPLAGGFMVVMDYVHDYQDLDDFPDKCFYLPTI